MAAVAGWRYSRQRSVRSRYTRRAARRIRASGPPSRSRGTPRCGPAITWCPCTASPPRPRPP